MRSWLLLPAALLAWLAAGTSTAAAQPAKACTSDTATAATIPEVQADYRRWQGRCVRLAGVLAERRLYVDRQALAEPVDSYGPPSPRSIVVYPEGPGRALLGPRMAEVIGTVGSCLDHHAVAEALQAENPDQIVMTTGWCHTSSENYVRPTAISPLSGRPILRLLEDELPIDSVQLVDVPKETPGLAGHVAAARAMAAAIAEGDEGAYFRLSAPDAALALADLKGARAPGWVRRDRRDSRRRFAADRARGSLFRKFHPLRARQERVLIDRSDLDPDAGGEPLDHAITCWCISPDCTGRWPVRSADADNAGGRPYACVRTNIFVAHGKGAFIHPDASRRPHPFAEP